MPSFAKEQYGYNHQYNHQLTKPAAHNSPRTPWTATRLSPTTFVLREHDAFEEHPLIYVKLHPTLNLLILTDTGCDRPASAHKQDDIRSLREYLELCPLEANEGRPLNPRGARKYLVLLTHCHYDHCLGLTRFAGLVGVEIVASAAGKQFVETDLEVHGQYAYFKPPIPVPRYTVTKWAEAFERLRWDSCEGRLNGEGDVDLGMVVLQTQGHTPDELAWYDEEESRLYVGDSLYEEGEDEMPIIFPKEGNLIEWVFSMQKLAVFVRGENARLAAEAKGSSPPSSASSSSTSSSGDLDPVEEWQEEQEDWILIALPRPTTPRLARRVLLSAAHQTQSTDAETILHDLEIFAHRVFIGAVPVVDKKMERDGEEHWLWRDGEKDGKGRGRSKMSIQAPARLVEDARRFFGIRV